MTTISKYKTEWDLNKHFFKSINDPEIDKIIEETKLNVSEFATKYNGLIHRLNTPLFLSYLEESAQLFKPLTKVYYFFSYLSTLDTQDQEVLKKINGIYTLWSDLSKQLVFVNEEYKLIGYDNLIALSEDPILKDYKNYLKSNADNLKYLLDENVEKALIETGKVITIFNDLYDELTNSFTYPFKGEMKGRAEVASKRESENEEERKEAFDSLNGVFGQKSNQIVIGNLYKSICKSNVASIKNRGYESVMEVRNISEDMDNNTVNNLLDKVRINFPIYHEFLKIKAKLLGKKKLDYWDIFAPIPKPGEETKFPFEKGLELYLENIKDFDLELYEYSKKVFEDGRVTVFPKDGKRDGAYASYGKDFESFVMLNYVDTFGDITTLAHELGHAFHGFLSQDQKEQVYNSPLSLAETASIFNETLLFENLLSGISKEEKAHYVAMKLDDFFSTTFRQVMYVLFERECHQRFLDGEELSYEDFNEVWFRYLSELYGDSVKLGDNMKYGWASIPHIYNTPFYCYAYSFGNILSFNLYQMYKETNKEDFVKIYKDILRSGGSMRPKELLMRNGIDIDGDLFYERAFDVAKNLIKELK